MILLDSPGREQFSVRDRDMVVAIADLAAVAIERARLTEELRVQGQVRQRSRAFPLAKCCPGPGSLRRPARETLGSARADRHRSLCRC